MIPPDRVDRANQQGRSIHESIEHRRALSPPGCGGALLVAAWLSAAPVLAQETTGTITGRVADQSGAVVPGATVTLKHLDTGRVTEAVSNENGLYLLSALQPGSYEATFALAGFQTVVVKGIELHVNDRLEVNGKLGVTAISETVEVSAASQFVQRTPAVQSLIGPTQVQELPLNNRSFALLATLVPGVSSDLGDEVNFGLTNTMSISINGGRRNAVNWLVDGVSNVDVGSNITLLSTPTLESIQEFKIITSSYAAEWPRSGGGVISIVTKGGTRRFSGTAYEFYRDEKLNANSFLRNLSTNPTAAAGPANLDYNNYGYTIGGPLLPSREKAFFFFSQEFRKITREAGVTATVPNPAWLTDPTNANYVAPADRDPNAVKLLAAFPAPNVGAQSYLNDSPAINDTRQEVVRVDVDVNQAWKLTGRYTHDLSQTREPGGLFFSTPVPNVGTTDTKVPGHVLAIEARTVKGQILNELKYQFSGNAINSTTPDGTVNTRDQYDLAIPELFPENNADRIPVIAIAGLSTFGATQGFRNKYFNHTIVDTVTWQRGSHSLKGGLLMAFERKNEYANTETQGRFAFGVGGGRSAFQNFLTGNRDGLCAAGCSYSESGHRPLQPAPVRSLRVLRPGYVARDDAADARLRHPLRRLSGGHRRRGRADQLRSGALRRRECADLRHLDGDAARRRLRRPAERHRRRRAELAVRPRHLRDRHQQPHAALGRVVRSHRRRHDDPARRLRPLLRPAAGRHLPAERAGDAAVQRFVERHQPAAGQPRRRHHADDEGAERAPGDGDAIRHAADAAVEPRRAAAALSPRLDRHRLRRLARRRPDSPCRSQPAAAGGRRRDGAPSTSPARIAATPGSRCARPAPSIATRASCRRSATKAAAPEPIRSPTR